MQNVLSSWRSARSTALKALSKQVAVGGEGDALQTAAEALAGLSLPVGDSVRAFGDLLGAIAMAARWEPARLSAEPDADRFRTAAAARAQALLDEASGVRPDLADIAADLTSLSDPREVAGIARRLLRAQLPPPVTGLRHQRERAWRPPEATPAPLSPILVLASIDGEPAPDPVALRPDRYHVLDLTARVASWPPDATRLKVDFLSALPATVIEVGGVEFESGRLEASTHLVLRADLGFDRPAVELVSRAAFVDASGQSTPVRVVGYRRIRVASFDPRTAMPLEMPIVAARVQEMMGELDASIPKLMGEDRRDLLTLLESIVRFAHRQQQKALKAGEERVDEAAFQRLLEDHFAADPGIGARIVRHAGASGGLTDLGLGRVPLELKVEHENAPSLEDAAKYMSQPEHYAVDRDSQISVLVVLDDSPKSAPPGVLSNYIGWLRPSLHGLTDPRYPSMVAVVIIPIRFPTPSTWSA